MAEDTMRIVYQEGGLGFGGRVSNTTDTGPETAFATQAEFRYLQETDTGDGEPLAVVELDAWYNIIGANREGMTTGVRGRAFLGIGYQFLETGEQGLDFYVLPHAVLDGSLAYNAYNANDIHAGVGVETGLMWRTGDVLMMASPVVMAGSFANRDIRDGSFPGLTGWLEIGGRGRLAAVRASCEEKTSRWGETYKDCTSEEKAYVSVEALYNPALDEYVERERMWSGLMLTASGTYNMTDKWGFGLYARSKAYSGVTPKSADFAETEAGATLLRRF